MPKQEHTFRHLISQQKVRAKQLIAEPIVYRSQDGNGPTLHIELSDIHWGHDAVDYKRIEEIRNLILTTDRVTVSLLGDLIEGLQPGYLDTNVTHLLIQDPLDQLISFREEFIKPLVMQGKLTAIVDGYTPSHDRWMTKMQGMNPTRVLTDGLHIAIVQNGGVIVFTYPDGQEDRFRVYHNTSRSGTITSPLTGLASSESSMPGYVDVALAGHLHHLGGSHGTYKGPQGKLTSYGQIAGFKTGEIVPDAFEMQSGRSQHQVPAGLATVQYTMGGEHHTYTTDVDQAILMFRASQLRYAVDQNSAAQELLNRISKDVEERPQIRFNEVKSSKRTDGSHNIDFLWTTLSYELRTKLPISILFAAGLRSGSKTEDQKLFRQIIGEAQRSHAFLLLLRRMIDAGVEQHSDRELVVGKMLKTLEPLSTHKEDNKILALLMDGILRYEAWKDPKVKVENADGRLTYDDPDGFMAATHISNTTGAPLISNQGRINILMRDVAGKKRGNQHSIMVLDRLEGAGSRSDATQGLFTIANRGLTTSVNTIPNIIVGGNMPGGGHATRPITKTGGFQTAIAPGWLAREHGEGGKGNRSPGSKGGYGILLVPDRHTCIPVSTVQEAAYWYESLTIYCGSELLEGFDTWMKFFDKRKGRRE